MPTSNFKFCQIFTELFEQKVKTDSPLSLTAGNKKLTLGDPVFSNCENLLSGVLHRTCIANFLPSCPFKGLEHTCARQEGPEPAGLPRGVEEV
jgi:hypothetical protein